MACIAKRRGRYVLDYYDNQGKRHRQTLKKGITKKKAKEKLREIEDQIAKGIFIPEMNIPTFKQAVEDWLNHKKPNLRASTWSVYEGHTNIYARKPLLILVGGTGFEPVTSTV